EWKALVDPAGDPADHLLHRPAQRRQPESRAVRAVAVRACAVDDEERLGRVLLERARGNARMRQVDCAADVTAAEELGAADVEEDESAGLERGMDVPAVGLELEQAA